jgi:hypothetical protein
MRAASVAPGLVVTRIYCHSVFSTRQRSFGEIPIDVIRHRVNTRRLRQAAAGRGKQRPVAGSGSGSSNGRQQR